MCRLHKLMQHHLTESGYVGDDVENVVQKLLIAADFDVQKAE